LDLVFPIPTAINPPSRSLGPGTAPPPPPSAELGPSAPLRLRDVKRALRLKPHQIAIKVAITTWAKKAKE
jgi:hypothetical protein